MYTSSEDMPSGFAQLYLLGYVKEAVEKIHTVIKVVLSAKAEKAVMMSAVDLYVMGKICKETRIDLPFKLEHISAFLKELIENGSISFTAKDAMVATFHDYDYMCRYLEIIIGPREIIGRMPGAEMKEMLWSGDKARTTGGRYEFRCVQVSIQLHLCLLEMTTWKRISLSSGSCWSWKL